MSCGPGPVTFRLLDAYVGWDAIDATGLAGLADPDGVTLAPIDPGAIDPGAVLGWMPPSWLARGCGPCEWYLVSPPPDARLRRRDPCVPCFEPAHGPLGHAGTLVDPVAVAARGHLVAVSDAGAGQVWILGRSGTRVLAICPVADPGPLAFTPWDELLVASPSSAAILRFGLAGDARGALPAPAPGVVDRIAVGHDCAIWIVTRTAAGSLLLWRARRGDAQFVPATLADLTTAFAPTGLVAAEHALGFCIVDTGSDGMPVERCYSPDGECLDGDAIPHPSPAAHVRQGQLLTLPIDSGIPRCRWHRLQLDADVPIGSTLAVAVSSSEDAAPASQGVSDPDWPLPFPAGTPHPSDWQLVRPQDGADFLVQQPPGRFLSVRLRLTGNGAVTPRVRRVRLDLPRETSLELLPGVYRDSPEVEDFTERFLSLFDSSIADIDRAIERAPALLDAGGVPDQLLPWLGAFVDIVFDPAWNAGERRALLRAAPQLFRMRGTIAGLALAIQLTTGAAPVIQELALERAWGTVGRDTQLGAVRLFSRASSRFQLGQSSLCHAPVKSFGNGDSDPLTALAYRFRVLLPPGPETEQTTPDRVRRIVESQKPAHTVASVRIGGTGFLVGIWSAVGIDTVFAAPPPPVLGADGNVRLSRASILAPSRLGCGGGARLGQASAVGVHTVVG